MIGFRNFTFPVQLWGKTDSCWSACHKLLVIFTYIKNAGGNKEDVDEDETRRGRQCYGRSCDKQTWNNPSFLSLPSLFRFHSLLLPKTQRCFYYIHLIILYFGNVYLLKMHVTFQSIFYCSFCKVLCSSKIYRDLYFFTEGVLG